MHYLYLSFVLAVANSQDCSIVLGNYNSLATRDGSENGVIRGTFSQGINSRTSYLATERLGMHKGCQMTDKPEGTVQGKCDNVTFVTALNVTLSGLTTAANTYQSIAKSCAWHVFTQPTHCLP